MERIIEISGDMIRLGQLLKLAGSVTAGADAKLAITSGHVTVNGEVEHRRGRQLHHGDIVGVDSELLRVVSATRLGEPGAGRSAE